MKDKPFALIGVNVNDRESKNLKDVMEKDNLPWRSFAHQDAINDHWNPSTPSYYIIDAKGMIRHKWAGFPGATAMDVALEKLIEEVDKKEK
jgi:peroxiredoxin